jgi:hypothetical protein
MLGFAGLNTGSCSGTNQGDDLNQNLRSSAQFVSFSQHPTVLSMPGQSAALAFVVD